MPQRISQEEMAAFKHAMSVLERVFSIARAYFGNGSKYDYLVPPGEEYLPTGLVAMAGEIERLKTKLDESQRTIEMLRGQLDMQKEITRVNRLFASTLIRHQSDLKGFFYGN